MNRFGRVLVLCAAVSVAACGEPVSPQLPGETALNIVVQGSTAQFDEGHVWVRGPTNRHVIMEPGTTDTIAGLQAGTYTVALEGHVGGVVEGYGERTNVQVQAGRTTTVSITLASFRPMVGSARCTTPLEFTVTVLGVAGAESYVVEWDTDPGFSTSSDSSVSNSTATITMSEGGRRYVRVRARSPYGSLGLWSDVVSVAVLPENPIVFARKEGAYTDIYVMNADGSSLMNLTNTPNTPEYAPKWSPDGTRIAFSRGAVVSEVFIMNADGTGVAEQTATASNAPIVMDWSPGGDSLVFDDYLSGTDRWDIYMIDLATGATTNLTSGLAGALQPDWSPDGGQIAFVSDLGGSDVDVHVMSAAGVYLQNLTPGWEWDYSPAWSPDGSKIVYYQNYDGIGYIRTMDADGSNQQNVTPSSGFVTKTEAAWSPDGTLIAFVSDEGGTWDIWVVNADGTGQPAKLTDDAAEDRWPDWWPGN
jgi:Tol biopolymer transport system component